MPKNHTSRTFTHFIQILSNISWQYVLVIYSYLFLLLLDSGTLNYRTGQKLRVLKKKDIRKRITVRKHQHYRKLHGKSRHFKLENISTKLYVHLYD